MLTCTLPAGKYTVLGQVIDGLEVLDKMEKAPTGELSHASALGHLLQSGH